MMDLELESKKFLCTNKWDKTFLSLCNEISLLSKDPSTKVGAVIVDNNNRIVSMGYNGFAKNVKDLKTRYLDRDEKLKYIIHGEVNAILFAKRDITGFTLYTTPFQPCSRCASLVVQAGITKVISFKSSIERWKEDFKLSSDIFREAGVELVLYDKE